MQAATRKYPKAKAMGLSRPILRRCPVGSSAWDAPSTTSSNAPLYGVKGQGWFLGFHCYERYVKVTFFRGASLDPVPPGQSKQKDVRYLDIHEDDLIDDSSLSDWIRQASALPGERL